MFPIYNYRKKRVRTNYIIICHAVDLVKKDIYINPNIIQGNYKYTWGTFQNYWIRYFYKYALPCHYFVELLDTDYVIYNGLPEFKPSYYIQELVDNHIIDYRFKDSVLIVIQENFSLEPPEHRMMEHLCDKLLADLINRYHLDWSRVKLLDECLTLDWKTQYDLNNLTYDIRPMKYFNKVLFKSHYNKFCNYP